MSSERAADLTRMELFSGLKKGPEKSLRQYARFEKRPPDHVFVSQDEYTDDFYVVLQGGVSAYRTNADGETEILDTLGKGSWFGELSALSNQPSLATLKSDSTCVLAVLDSALFKEVYVAGGKFREMVDEKYRERGLLMHLRIAPIFKGTPDVELRKLRRLVRFESFEKGMKIARAGEPADAVYLVRSGAVSCVSHEESGAERILGYYMNNSSFGERCLTEDKREWPGDYVCLARTDVLVVPRKIIVDTFGQDTNTLNTLETAASLIVADEEGEITGYHDFVSDPGRSSEASAEEMELMVRRQSIKGGEALVIDLKRCTRCNACVESCVAVHADGIPRLSKKGNRISADLSLTTSCYNCEIPECMMSCNYGAIRRDVQGQIRFVYDNCTGCSMCVSACPYDVIRLTPPPGQGPLVSSPSILENLPLIGSWFRKECGSTADDASEPLRNPRGQKITGKAIKCDLCAGLPFEACIYNCPCNAISRVPPAEIWDRERIPIRN